MKKDPFSDIGMARMVIEQLNTKKPFENKFELSGLEDSKKIKVSSIILYALKYLVTDHPQEGQKSLFTYWDGDKTAFNNKDMSVLDDYISFCTTILSTYFSAVSKVFTDQWNSETKLLSIVSINGFIIALTRQISKDTLEVEYEYYYNHISKMKIDFTKDSFGYSGSQYRKFSDQILCEAFDWSDDEISIK